MKSNSAKFVLGINSAYHEPAACLIRNGEIVAAVEEERFNRVRHGKRADLLNPHEIPVRSIKYCLDAAGIRAQELGGIAFSFLPQKRLEMNVTVDRDAEPGCAGTPEGEQEFHRLLRTVPQRLSDFLGTDVTERFSWLEHHLCHAASAFFVSPFEKAAILSVDGIGEATSTWLGVGEGGRIRPLKEIRYPSSLGFLWTKMSRFLGFGEYGQWKVMGLAGFGDANRYYGAFRQFVDFDDDGNFIVDNEILQFRADRYVGFERLFGPRRMPGDEIEERHQDVGAALQRLTNEIQLSLAGYLHRVTGLKHLCQAGGVALNCIANRVILEEGPFENVFIQPAANDAGTAVGAAYYLWNNVMGQPRAQSLNGVYLGPEFDSVRAVEDLFPGARRSENIAEEAANLLAQGEIVAWFQGRMEFGPRALGNRSILADPRRPEMVHQLNDKIKHREFFRPFGASIMAEKGEKWFHFAKRGIGDAFMLYARKVRPEKLGQIPAVTHVDGTSRIQCVDATMNPRFHQLLCEFDVRTGVPLLLNTSFNDREPIICTPVDAVETCIRAGIRYLAIGDYLVDFKRENVRAWGLGTTNWQGTADLSRATVNGPHVNARVGAGCAKRAAESSVGVLDDASLDQKALDQPVEWVFRSR